MPADQSNGLVPRTGQQPRLIEGPKIGQRSLYQQQVLDEDRYTEALSHIITRDFFPNLPHLHATNDYLTALTTNDPDLLSSSIRRLARIAQDKEDRRDGRASTSGSASRAEMSDAELETERVRRRELEMMGTPYISIPGRTGATSRRQLPHRTPLGARGWDTPCGEASVRRRPAEAEDIYDVLDNDVDEVPAADGETPRPGPSTRRKRRRNSPPRQVVRDDLSLDAFQRNYTSEDNASFVQIVDAENRQRREERWGWAWDVERVAEDRRLEGEERRKLILDTATSGGWRVDADGRRLIGGLAEGGRDRAEGEAWKDRKMITAAAVAAVDVEDQGETKTERGPEVKGETSSTAVVRHTAAGALIKSTDAAASSALPPPAIVEEPLPSDHPLSKALAIAGLPATALVSTEDGVIVPQRETVSGSGEGRGRGALERAQRDRIEKDIMGEEKQEVLAAGGSGVDQWPYKTMNSLMFPADANTKPYPVHGKLASSGHATTRQAPPQIAHSNTRLPDEDEEPTVSRAGSRRASSPARSWVDAAVKGTPYHPRSSLPSVDSYPLLPEEPDLEPDELPPLMTWGTLLATPRALGDSGADPLDLSGPSFRLPETKRRDEIGRKLGNKASKSISDRARGFKPAPVPSTPSLTEALRAAADRTRTNDRSVRGNGRAGAGTGASSTMAPPSATPRREDGLTPAAKNLLDRSLGRTPQRLGTTPLRHGMGSGARARGAAMDKGAGWAKGSSTFGSMSWTPSPSARR